MCVALQTQQWTLALYLEWLDKQKKKKKAQGDIIVCWVPLQFLSGFVPDTISMPSRVHPPLTMKREGGGQRVQLRK